jgi:hypothetical protein
MGMNVELAHGCFRVRKARNMLPLSQTKLCLLRGLCRLISKEGQHGCPKSSVVDIIYRVGPFVVMYIE